MRANKQRKTKNKFQPKLETIYPRTHSNKILSDLVFEKDLDGIIEMVKNGADINEKFKNNSTALIVACENGFTEVVKCLISQGADINLINSHGHSALVYASHMGHIDIVKILIEHGADLNLPNERDFTPIHASLKGKHFEICKLLIEAGADVNKKNILGDRVLNLSCRLGCSEIVEILVRSNVVLEGIPQAFRDACCNKHIQIVKLLLTLEGIENHWRWGFSDACRLRCKEIIEMIINKRPTVEDLSEALMTTIYCNDSLEIMEMLIQAGADVNYNSDARFGSNPLSAAVFQRSSLSINLLLKYGAIPNKNKNGYTDLMTACSRYCGEDIIRSLLEHGTEVNAVNEDGKTALMIACDNGFIRIVKLLMDYGAEINVISKSGKTALTKTVYKMRLDVVKLLIDRGAIDFDDENFKHIYHCCLTFDHDYTSDDSDYDPYETDSNCENEGNYSRLIYLLCLLGRGDLIKETLFHSFISDENKESVFLEAYENYDLPMVKYLVDYYDIQMSKIKSVGLFYEACDSEESDINFLKYIYDRFLYELNGDLDKLKKYFFQKGSLGVAIRACMFSGIEKFKFIYKKLDLFDQKFKIYVIIKYLIKHVTKETQFVLLDLVNYSMNK